MISDLLSWCWLLLPLVAWLAVVCGKLRLHPVLVYLLTCVVGYFVLLLSVFILDAELEARMNSFDLDGNGSFSGAELTAEAKEAMEDWSSDTGRNFAPIFGVPFTMIWYSLTMGLLFGVGAIVKSLWRKKKRKQSADADVLETELVREEDGNPFRPPLT